MQVKSKRGQSANLSEVTPGASFELSGRYYIKSKSTRGAPGTSFVCVDLRDGELTHLSDQIVYLAPGHFQLT